MSLSNQHQSKGGRPDQTVFISTYGCQMNVNDTERMYTLLEMADYHPVSSPDLASLIIINACSVREKPVHKVYSEVGRYKELKRRKPELKIGVGGCVGQQEKGGLMTHQNLIDFVFGPDNIDQLPSLVAKVQAEDEKLMGARFDYKNPYQVETLVRNPGVSAFVNITKGCDNFCSFCIVPFTRGRERSRELKLIVQDIHNLTRRGVKEVTLLGQNVNSYKSNCGGDFADLMQAVAQDTEVQRIRFTTSHPKDFNEKLVRVMARHKNKICEYIHLPVQSGNSEVLQKMNRGYSRQDYLGKVEMIRADLPEAVLSTDIIVGFPGETDSQFDDTMSLVEKVGYESIFSFKYSSRPFTKAARFTDQIAESVKAQRLTRLQEAHKIWAYEMAKSYENKVVEVLVEEYREERGRLFGRSRQNKNVHFAGSDDLVGQTVDVLINEAHPNTLHGELQ